MKIFSGDDAAGSDSLQGISDFRLATQPKERKNLWAGSAGGRARRRWFFGRWRDLGEMVVDLLDRDCARISDAIRASERHALPRGQPCGGVMDAQWTLAPDDGTVGMRRRP